MLSLAGRNPFAGDVIGCTFFLFHTLWLLALHRGFFLPKEPIEFVTLLVHVPLNVSWPTLPGDGRRERIAFPSPPCQQHLPSAISAGGPQEISPPPLCVFSPSPSLPCPHLPPTPSMPRMPPAVRKCQAFTTRYPPPRQAPCLLAQKLRRGARRAQCRHTRSGCLCRTQRKHNEGNLISQEGVWHRFFFLSPFLPPRLSSFSLVMAPPAWHGAAHSSGAATTPPRVKPITFSGFGGDQKGKKI